MQIYQEMKAGNYVLRSNGKQQQSQATEVFKKAIELERTTHSLTLSKTGANRIGVGNEI